MRAIGFHASHEQFGPDELLALVAQAEAAGFDCAMCSDHFHPWSRVQGQSGHAWSWLGASLAGTRIGHGTVTSPVGRYHPAVVAQAAATLSTMFPQRFWIALGSGEAINEAITGEPWPPKEARNRRLEEAAEVLRALWRGEEVDHDGEFVVRKARLYTRPQQPPTLLVAALSAETARWGAGWADGLLTVSTERERMREIVDAFRAGGGAGKPMYLQVKLSWAQDDDQALQGALAQWRTNVFPPQVSEDFASTAQYEALGRDTTEDDIRRAVRVAADTGRHAGWLREDFDMGFDHLYLHNVGTNQAGFIEAFAREVLPQLRAGSVP